MRSRTYRVMTTLELGSNHLIRLAQPHQWDAAIGRIMASAPLTIRIDLDPAP